MNYTPETLAAAVSPESAIVIPDYPYGFRLRCIMRVWIEYKPGKGFRYCTQTTNPKKPGTVWNAPKRGTYSKVSMALYVDGAGHIHADALSEYSALPEYVAFWDKHSEALSRHARGSFDYYREVKEAYENALKAEGVDNIYSATPEQRKAVTRAWLPVCAAHTKAGTAY